jgi:hypothetical protein
VEVKDKREDHRHETHAVKRSYIRWR